MWNTTSLEREHAIKAADDKILYVAIAEDKIIVGSSDGIAVWNATTAPLNGLEWRVQVCVGVLAGNGLPCSQQWWSSRTDERE